MAEKLKEYFENGVRLVWFVRPRSRVVDVYTAPDRFTRLTASMRLDGGDVLPGFSVQVGELFPIPKRPSDKGKEKKEKRNGPQLREEERAGGSGNPGLRSTVKIAQERRTLIMTDSSRDGYKAEPSAGANLAIKQKGNGPRKG